MSDSQDPSEDNPTVPETLPSLQSPQGALFVSSTGTTLPRYRNEPTIGAEDDTGKETSTCDSQAELHSRSNLEECASISSRTLCESGHDSKKPQDAVDIEPTGVTVDPSSAEAKRRIRQLERDVRGSGMKSSRPSTVGLFKAMCATDLLFLIDTTASMNGYINAAKAQIMNIVEAITEAFFNEAEVRIAVVGYKDHQDTPNIQFFDFARSADRVHSFLSTLKATGGGDIPEDVLGGIRQALNASWKSPTRCIIHIADAPPHGNMFHHISDGLEDDFPVPGSEPHRLLLGPLVEQMVQLKINYALLRINSSTDRMAFNIYKAYKEASAQCNLLKTNYYYYKQFGVSSESRTAVQNSSSKGNHGLMFEEAELGTAYSALQHLVVKNVTASVSHTIGRMSGPAQARRPWIDNKLASLGGIVEDDGNAGLITLETVAPQWESIEWFNKTLLVEGFSPDVMFHDASTLDDMMAADDNIKMRTTDLTIRKRSQPFAQGAMRLACYARTGASTNRFVVKSYKKDGKQLAHLAEDMRCQALCKAFALEFNALSEEDHPIDFIVTTCFRDKRGRSSNNECMSLEPFLDGEYTKYNNNAGYISQPRSNDRFHEAAQAFSHFTFERSRGQFLVSDLQGVDGLLTDPAVHALDRKRFRLSDTNLGVEGLKFFFATHRCNDICKKLKLKSDASMIKTCAYKFRDDWPNAHDTLCCSNKLCGRIIHLENAQESEMYRGYRWCDACWPQLDVFMTRSTCVASGSQHEFSQSQFFYESQGLSTPRKCTSHRGGSESVLQRTWKISQSDLSRLFRRGGSLWHMSDGIDEEEEEDLKKDNRAEIKSLDATQEEAETAERIVRKRTTSKPDLGGQRTFGSALRSAIESLACFK